MKKYWGKHKGKLKPFAIVASVFAGVTYASSFISGWFGFLGKNIPLIGFSWAGLLVGTGALFLADYLWGKYVK